MTATPKDSVVGLQEIATMLEVGVRTPHAWLYRKVLPPPDYASVNGLRAWDRSTILAWAEATGRLPGRRGPAHGRGGREAKAANVEAWAGVDA